ncbi:hypothetical protein ATANTOWER_002220 [Ataeniobius toweri]|uniref:Uncharacterized protein n=1 Tax=Ataeniobius toweri TaxID=208326 RepID=A0ABU7CG29_9TELE|nr:hypothetical protein [Ataeniobius toweri]
MPSGIISHFVSRDSPLLQIPAATAADRTGRRSSDATVNYITEYETAHHCFQLGNETQLPRNWSITVEKKSHVDFHSFSPLANEKTKQIKLTGIRRLVSFQLYQSKTWI